MYMYHVPITQIKTSNIPHMLEESLIPPPVNNPQKNVTDSITINHFFESFFQKACS